MHVPINAEATLPIASPLGPYTRRMGMSLDEFCHLAEYQRDREVIYIQQDESFVPLSAVRQAIDRGEIPVLASIGDWILRRVGLSPVHHYVVYSARHPGYWIRRNEATST